MTGNRVNAGHPPRRHARRELPRTPYLADPQPRGALGERQRHLLTLIREGHHSSVIAQQLTIPESAVDHRLHRAGRVLGLASGTGSRVRIVIADLSLTHHAHHTTTPGQQPP